MKNTPNPTRMVLLKTRRRNELAKRGHKLLKDKLDGLVKKFLQIVAETEVNLRKISEEMPLAMSSIVLAGSQIGVEEFAEMAYSAKRSLTVETERKNIMGVRVPRYDLKDKEGTPFIRVLNTPSELDHALSQFNEKIPDLLALAGNFKALELISKEISKVKRRVNALEHILIPELGGVIKFIRMKLSEMERGYATSLMKIKDIVRSK